MTIPADQELKDACEAACRDLPPGWEIVISLEQNAGTVELLNWAGDEKAAGPEDETIPACVRRMIAQAREES